MKRAAFIILLSLVMLISLAGCEAPGEGKQADAGYAACQPVIDALTAYQQDHQDYPEDLDALVPEYLAEIPPDVNGFPIEYLRDTAGGYTLQFSYTKPGMNECVYTPAEGWACSGYF